MKEYYIPISEISDEKRKEWRKEWEREKERERKEEMEREKAYAAIKKSRFNRVNNFARALANGIITRREYWKGVTAACDQEEKEILGFIETYENAFSAFLYELRNCEYYFNEEDRNIWDAMGWPRLSPTQKRAFEDAKRAHWKECMKNPNC